MIRTAGVETQIRPTTPGHVEMDIRDDQVMLQVKACMLERQGFVQALVAFTASAIGTYYYCSLDDSI